MIWIHGAVFLLLFLVSLPGIKEKRDKILGAIAPSGVITGAVLILMAGNVLGTVVTVAEMTERRDGVTEVEKEPAEGQEQTVILEAEKEDGSRQEVHFTIPGTEYSKEEIQKWFREGKEKLEKIILGENQSLDHVNSNLNLVNTIPDLPIEIGWGSSDPQLLDWEGRLGENIPAEGTAVTLYVAFTCQDEREDFEWKVKVYPPALSAAEQWERNAQENFRELNQSSETGDIWYLPAEVEGKAVDWKKPFSGAGMTAVATAWVMAMVWIVGKKRERMNAQKRRQEEMITDYPEILNKFVLLLNAGMNTRKAFSKIALDYRKKKQADRERFRERAAYEEIASVYSEMEQGVPEAEAYEHLGSRCGLAVYKTFSTLLVQNLRKGNGEIIDMLEREAVEAFENRKRRAKILGEQAGTKLLLPMVMMLVIVFVILLFPAGSSFAI
ncbi:MAG: type II secretion system F family protein [Ruminococcus sp.]|jgi:tight adherence protein C